MARLLAYLTGVAMVAAFSALTISGTLHGGNWFVGWFVCGVYGVTIFCACLDGHPENVLGNGPMMIALGTATLLGVLLMAYFFESEERQQRPRAQKG